MALSLAEERLVALPVLGGPGHWVGNKWVVETKPSAPFLGSTLESGKDVSPQPGSGWGSGCRAGVRHTAPLRRPAAVWGESII